LPWGLLSNGQKFTGKRALGISVERVLSTAVREGGAAS
jgi:hypothetical protein